MKRYRIMENAQKSAPLGSVLDPESGDVLRPLDRKQRKRYNNPESVQKFASPGFVLDPAAQTLVRLSEFYNVLFVFYPDASESLPFRIKKLIRRPRLFL